MPHSKVCSINAPRLLEVGNDQHLQNHARLYRQTRLPLNRRSRADAVQSHPPQTAIRPEDTPLCVSVRKSHTLRKDENPMSKFVALTESNGGVLHVNPDHVAIVSQNGGIVGESKIMMNFGLALAIKGSCEETIARLENKPVVETNLVV